MVMREYKFAHELKSEQQRLAFKGGQSGVPNSKVLRRVLHPHLPLAWVGGHSSLRLFGFGEIEL
jgi:hypothetical protein